MTILLIFSYIALILYIFVLFLNYFAFYDLNLKFNLNIFNNKKIKFEYKQIKKTNLFLALKFTLKNKNHLYPNRLINENERGLLSLAKFVDKQIKLNKCSF